MSRHEIDLKCKKYIEANLEKFGRIEKLVSKEQLVKWTELLRGLEPIHTDRETVEEWAKKYESKVEGLLDLDKTMKEFAEKTGSSRVLTVCSIRKLQQSHGLKVNHNTYKDSALKMLVSLSGHETLPTHPQTPYDESWIPQRLLDLEPLSRGKLPKPDSKLDVQNTFEDRLHDAFTFLKYEVDRLGHKHPGREPDGIAKSRKEHYAIIYDAKSSTEGYKIGTDDRRISEYHKKHRERLEDEGYRPVYFTIISSDFKGDFQRQAGEISINENLFLTLLKVKDLLLVLERRAQYPRKFNHKILKTLFHRYGLVSNPDELLQSD